MNIGPILYLIPARKGSEGLPKKNFKKLFGKPLIFWSYDFAKKIAREEDQICISTNDELIIDYCIKKEVEIHFIRPDFLSKKNSTTDSVINHALKFFESKGKIFEYIMLLQPTSPFRFVNDYKQILSLLDKNIDMVVSVKECKDNPYFNMYIENSNGGLKQLNSSNHYTRRQDTPKVYGSNGAFYFFKVTSFKLKNKIDFKNIKKYLMPNWQSIDIDTIEDWDLAVYYGKKYLN